jgi:hypothetical protein
VRGDASFKGFKIYLTYDSADAHLARELQKVLAKRTTMCDSLLRRYEDDGTKVPNLTKLRSAQVVVFLLSSKAASATGWLKEHLWIEFGEAINYGMNALVFLFADDPSVFSQEVLGKISRPKRSFLIPPDESSGAIDQRSFLSQLAEFGCLVDIFSTSEKRG